MSFCYFYKKYKNLQINIDKKKNKQYNRTKV